MEISQESKQDTLLSLKKETTSLVPPSALDKKIRDALNIIRKEIRNLKGRK